MEKLEWRVALGVVAGFVLGWLVATRPQAWLAVDLLSVVTALGTVGAVWAAVWTTRRGERWREMESAERISRASASFAIRSRGVFNLVSATLNTAESLMKGAHYPDAYRMASEVVYQAIDELQRERAAAVAFLPEACSQRVETAIELLRSAQRNIELSEPAMSGLNEAGVRAVISNVLAWTRPAMALLRDAALECVKASPKHAEHWPKNLELIKLGAEHYRDD